MNRYLKQAGSTVNVVNTGATSIPLLPAGGYRLYTSQFVPLPVDVVISSAVEAQIGLGTVEIAPNPSSSYTNVWLTMEKSGEYTVEVVTMDGRKVFTAQDLSFYEGDNHFEIDISAFNPGVYLLRIQDGEGRFIVKRFVKM